MKTIKNNYAPMAAFIYEKHGEYLEYSQDDILWVIAVGKGYGRFLFEGTEKEAEEMRCIKSITEEAISKKKISNKRRSKIKNY